MKKLWKKNIEVPTEEKTTIEAIETWTVSWDSAERSYPTSYHAKLKKHYQGFTTKQNAELFANSLKEAEKLLKNCNVANVTVEKES